VLIHTDRMTYRDLHLALKDAGLVDAGVYLDRCDESGSRSRARKFDTALEGQEAPHRRRRRNTGRYGAESFGAAATWMEWGWWIAVMFRYDPDAIIGQYAGRANFLEQTRVMVATRGWRAKDPSVKNFAREYASWWPNHISDPARDPKDTGSPFALVDRIYPARQLVPLHDTKVVDAWLETP
jgi:hypothetical protein